MRSFILSMVFRKVDFPNPEGPMNAVTLFAMMSSDLFFSAWKSS